MTTTLQKLQEWIAPLKADGLVAPAELIEQLVQQQSAQPQLDPVHEYRKGFIDGQIDMRDRTEEQPTQPDRTCAQGCNGCDDCIDDDGQDDATQCPNCKGAETDPGCDHLLPCPVCQGEQQP